MFLRASPQPCRLRSSFRGYIAETCLGSLFPLFSSIESCPNTLEMKNHWFGIAQCSKLFVCVLRMSYWVNSIDSFLVVTLRISSHSSELRMLSTMIWNDSVRSISVYEQPERLRRDTLLHRLSGGNQSQNLVSTLKQSPISGLCIRPATHDLHTILIRFFRLSSTHSFAELVFGRAIIVVHMMCCHAVKIKPQQFSRPIGHEFVVKFYKRLDDNPREWKAEWLPKTWKILTNRIE